MSVLLTHSEFHMSVWYQRSEEGVRIPRVIHKKNALSRKAISLSFLFYGDYTEETLICMHKALVTALLQQLPCWLL